MPITVPPPSEAPRRISGAPSEPPITAIWTFRAMSASLPRDTAQGVGGEPRARAAELPGDQLDRSEGRSVHRPRGGCAGPLGRPVPRLRIAWTRRRTRFDRLSRPRGVEGVLAHAEGRLGQATLGAARVHRPR